MAWNKKIGVPSEPWSRGSRFWIFVDKLALMQSEGADYAHHISTNTLTPTPTVLSVEFYADILLGIKMQQ